MERDQIMAIPGNATGSNDPVATLRALGLLGDLDVHFARFMGRLAARAVAVSASVAEKVGSAEPAPLELAAAQARPTPAHDECGDLLQ